jgi:hypothetical protein
VGGAVKVLNAIIVIVFIVIGLSYLTKADKPTPGLIALLIANVSLVGIGIENALDRNPIEIPEKDEEGAA